MRKIFALAFLGVSLFAEIKIDENGIKKMGITIKQASMSNSETVGPFVGTFDYDDSKSKNYILSSEGIVLKTVKNAGDIVKKGDTLCVISSSELMANTFELKDAKNRLKALSNNAKKDETLYKDGVISFREYQKSSLEASSLSSRVSELENRLSMSGVSVSTDGTFAVKAKKDGILSLSPKKGGQKIEPFLPYLKISDISSLVAYIKIPPVQLGNIKKGATVTDKTGNKIGVLTGVANSVNETTNSAQAVVKITSAKEDYRAGTAHEFFISVPKGESTLILPRSSITKYKNSDICFVKTKNGFDAKTVYVIKETKEGIYIRPGVIKDGAEIAVGGIINLKGALSGLGFE
ncbi:MAG: efflux RND transporter periplasmic adaptor subunit [Campylobacterales bacterium]|nr:efflux RND transporter periplasmic adaptor subunit [Campylobacterales bacterium]